MPFTTPSTAPVAPSKISRRRLTRNSTGYANAASSADVTGCGLRRSLSSHGSSQLSGSDLGIVVALFWLELYIDPMDVAGEAEFVGVRPHRGTGVDANVEGFATHGEQERNRLVHPAGCGRRAVDGQGYRSALTQPAAVVIEGHRKHRITLREWTFRRDGGDVVAQIVVHVVQEAVLNVEGPAGQ